VSRQKVEIKTKTARQIPVLGDRYAARKKTGNKIRKNMTKRGAGWLPFLLKIIKIITI
jgi:hypothetical protein